LEETMILYDNFPILGLDERELAFARLREIDHLIQNKTLIKMASILSNPYECWGDLLEKTD